MFFTIFWVYLKGLGRMAIQSSMHDINMASLPVDCIYWECHRTCATEIGGLGTVMINSGLSWGKAIVKWPQRPLCGRMGLASIHALHRRHHLPTSMLSC